MGSTVQRWLEEHQADFAEEFRQCGRLARESGKYVASFAVNSRAGKEVALVTLFVRLLQLYESAIWLVQFGMGPGSRAVLRAELETAFILGAIAKDDSALTRYIAQDSLQRSRLVNALQRTTSPLLAALKKLAHESGTAVRGRVERNGAKPLHVEEYARMAGLQEWYDTAYRLLSGAVHTGVGDIARAHVLMTEGEIGGIHAGPTRGDTCFVITTGSHLVLMSAETLTAALGRGDLTRLMELKPYFLELGRSAIERFRPDL